MRVCVIGSGYVGLVTGTCLSDFGNRVVCIDKDKEKIKGLKKGAIDFYELGLRELVIKNVKAGRLIFDSNLEKGVRSSDLIFIAVGTPPLANGEADLAALERVILQLSAVLKSGSCGHKVIVVKSTVPVGTSELVEKLLKSRKISPKKFEVVSNPEFLREGKAVADFLHPDRIVIGAAGHKACNLLAELYRPLNARIVFMDRRSSEMVKYASNVFLAARLSLVNEFANICEKVGANISQVIEGIGYDKRIGSSYLRAGIGYGGSCLPKDVSALACLANKHGYDPIMLKSVNQVNLFQRELFALKIISILKKIKGKRVGIWGLAFKPQTDDLRDAPSIAIIERLLQEGITIKAYDPMTNGKTKKLFPLVEYCSDPYLAVKGCDAVVIITEWNEFREIDLERVKKAVRQPIVIDGRNIFNPALMRENGFKYYGVGVGN